MTTPASLLYEAAQLITKAMNRLDIEELPQCCECGRKSYRNFTHAKLYQQLEKQPRKLRRIADELKSVDAATVAAIGESHV